MYNPESVSLESICGEIGRSHRSELEVSMELSQVDPYEGSETRVGSKFQSLSGRMEELMNGVRRGLRIETMWVCFLGKWSKSVIFEY
jgi:hypothetical protein